MTNPYIIKGKSYNRIAKTKNIGVAEAILSGLLSRGYDAIMFVDGNVYRVVVAED